ncbi:MAG TPA: glycosyltransferase family 2 protein [Aestuariivirga sp.]|nr:glycosyltransferase family 2 protein [Aestuariivirga sp.]
MTILGVVLGIIAVLLFLPVAILLVEILGALFMRKDGRGLTCPQRPAGLRVAVIVPAHNEEDGIGTTVCGISSQLGAHDRLIVVADNCADATVERARTAGAETITRFDPQRRGKGYALDFGVRHLQADPPNIVVIVDADCRLGPGAINTLVACVNEANTAAQAFNAVVLPREANVEWRVASFAWTIKNHLRPMGLAALGLPCQLMGTGMAIPWEAIRGINLATGSIVEDVNMGLDVAALGFAPIYCPAARVESDFPTTERGFMVQRRRWEVGSLHVAMKTAPIMFLRGASSSNIPLMAMALDLVVPPLTMLLIVLMLGMIGSFIFVIAGGSTSFFALFALWLGGLTFTLVMAWFQFGRDVLLASDLAALPRIFVRKFSLYLIMWRDRGVGWVRTDRK